MYHVCRSIGLNRQALHFTRNGDETVMLGSPQHGGRAGRNGQGETNGTKIRRTPPIRARHLWQICVGLPATGQPSWRPLLASMKSMTLPWWALAGK